MSRKAAAVPATKKDIQTAIAKMQGQLLSDMQANMPSMTPQRSETRWRGASQILRSMAGWLPWLGSGRSDTPKAERDRMAARSYDAYRNHMLGGAAVGRITLSVVGTGVIMHPNPDREALGLSEEQADELKKTIAREWRLYYENPRECHWEGILDGYGQQTLSLLTALLGGDCFALTPMKEREGCTYETKLQLIDPARASNPNDTPDTQTMQDGVELSPDGEPIAVHFRNTHPGDRTLAAVMTRWDRREIYAPSGRRRVLQVWQDHDRIGATRGVGLLAPILEPLQTLEQYSRAELMAAAVSAMFTVFIEHSDAVPTDDRGNPLPPIKGQTVQPTITKGMAGDIALGPAAVVDLGPGEKAAFASPTRPNAQFNPFFEAIVGQMGARLGMPKDELLLVYAGSYSAARAAMLRAWAMYSTRRWWLVQQLCKPHYELWFDEAVAIGRIKVANYADPAIRAAVTQAIWIGPAKGAMDENQEATASGKRIEIGISNETIECAQMTGEVWSDVYATRQRELAQRKRDGTMPAVPGAPAPATPNGPATLPAPNNRQAPSEVEDDAVNTPQKPAAPPDDTE